MVLGSANGELLHVLRQGDVPFLYVWGEAGSGKCYLRRAWALAMQGRGLRVASVDARCESLLPGAAEADCIAVGHAEVLDADSQILLFDAFNRIRHSGHGALLVTGATAPAELSGLREDLRTRLSFGLSYRIRPLGDTEKLTALAEAARQRQLHIGSDLFVWLMRYWRRDIGSLLALVECLDDYSVAGKYPLTLPVLKQFLQEAGKEITATD